ncbi:hypothetical protein [Cryptosporangium japonicum]|uniref:Integral membrane protein n=1 Tax=Cryptosporangium japonicum TaxID=80872 RepID=A0ABN0V8Z4_9ACTN
MTQTGARRTRPLLAAAASAAVLVGLVLAVSAAVGGPGTAPLGLAPLGLAPLGLALLCCVPGAGAEGALLRSTAQHRAAIAVTVTAALGVGAVVWPGGAALLAAVVAVTSVPVVLAVTLGLSPRAIRFPAAVFRVLVGAGLASALPVTTTGGFLTDGFLAGGFLAGGFLTGGFLAVAAAAAATALTIQAVHRRSTRSAPATPRRSQSAPATPRP